MRSLTLLLTVLLATPAAAAQEITDTLGASRQSFGTVARPAVVLDSATAHDRIAERVRSGRNMGIAAAIVDGAGVRFISEGFSRDTFGTPIDEQTVFEVGSVSKVFTALLLAEMVERNELRLSNPAYMYLPDTMRMPAMGGDSITLLHLATHTSGLPRLPLNMSVRDMRNPYADYAPHHLYAFLATHQMQRQPGERYEYSNVGSGLLGHLLALRSGATYQALLLERVVRPMGLRETMITLGPTLQQRFATGHDALGDPTAHWDLNVLEGAAALKSTAADLALFVRACLAAQDSPDDRIIVRALRRSMEPHMVVQEGRAWMGLGWHILERGGRRIVMHNGQTGGFAAFIGLDPERGVGVVLLTNSSRPVDDIALALLTGG